MTATTVAPGTCEVLEQAGALVAGARGSVNAMSGREVSVALRKVTRVIAAAEALKVELVGQFNQSRVWDSGARDASPEKVLAQEHLLDAGQAVRDVKADTIIAIGLRNQQRQDAFGPVAGMFLEMAEQTPPAVFKNTLKAWADQVDPVTTGRDEAAAHARRSLKVFDVSGGVRLEGFFGSEQGMKLMTALNGALSAHRKNTPTRQSTLT